MHWNYTENWIKDILWQNENNLFSYEDLVTIKIQYQNNSDIKCIREKKAHYDLTKDDLAGLLRPM